jgi:hypothetical protein
VDFKSNPFGKDNKSFFDSHLMQLLGTEKALAQNFGLKVDALYNWSPDGWKNKPSYTFHKWNVKESDKKCFDIYENLASVKGLFRPHGNISVFNDKWSTENFDAELVTQYGYVEYVKEVLKG